MQKCTQYIYYLCYKWKEKAYTYVYMPLLILKRRKTNSKQRSIGKKMKKIKELIQNRSSIQIVVLEDENRENWRGKQKTKTKIYSNY